VRFPGGTDGPVARLVGFAFTPWRLRESLEELDRRDGSVDDYIACERIRIKRPTAVRVYLSAEDRSRKRCCPGSLSTGWASSAPDVRQLDLGTSVLEKPVACSIAEFKASYK